LNNTYACAFQVGLDVYRSTSEEQSLQSSITAERRQAAAADQSVKREEQAIAGFEQVVKQQQEVSRNVAW
jgi:hypothetical protein